MDSTLRAQELMGRSVYTADGKRLGRVYDIVAEKHGDALCVTGLIVGPAAWLQRYGWTKRPHGRFLRWESLATVRPKIILRRGTQLEE